MNLYVTEICCFCSSPVSYEAACFILVNSRKEQMIIARPVGVCVQHAVQILSQQMRCSSALWDPVSNWFLISEVFGQRRWKWTLRPRSHVLVADHLPRVSTPAALPHCPWRAHPVWFEGSKWVLSHCKYSLVISSYFPGQHPQAPQGESCQTVWNHEASRWSKAIVYIARHWCFFGRSGILWQSSACYPCDPPSLRGSSAAQGEWQWALLQRAPYVWWTWESLVANNGRVRIRGKKRQKRQEGTTVKNMCCIKNSPSQRSWAQSAFFFY